MHSEPDHPDIQLTDQLRSAIEMPNGARFYRCALQINPFKYLETQSKSTSFASEQDYNNAIIEACLENNIEVIAVTDHYRVKYSVNLVNMARDAGIHAFMGFEAVTKDGVHFLCLFNPEDDENLVHYIGEFQIPPDAPPSPTGALDATELLERAKSWRAVCIAAHATTHGGLLDKLSGQTRINVWTDPNLLACAIRGSVDDEEREALKLILKNKDPQHYRVNVPAILNSSDINDPADLNEDSASCFIKMSDVSVEAFPTGVSRSGVASPTTQRSEA